VRTLLLSPWIVAFGACLAGLLLWHAPEGLTQCIHAMTTDALFPGYEVVGAVEQTARDWCSLRTDSKVAELQARLDRAEDDLHTATERVQRLSAQLASLRSTPQDPWTSVNSAFESERLLVPALIEAAVLGEATSQAWREGRFLDRGWKHGVRESAVVLQGRGPLVDLGAAAGIAPEDALLVGRTIVGKVAAVGRWTSIILPVTDPAYRGRAQLVRESEGGPVWGASGLLRGDGNGRCRLEGVPVEDAVRVGDLVFSGDRDGALSAALAYGRVVEAGAAPGDREWTLVVEPAADPNALTHVHVLRAALNPSRVWTD